jgi:hypothetical protein
MAPQQREAIFIFAAPLEKRSPFYFGVIMSGLTLQAAETAEEDEMDPAPPSREPEEETDGVADPLRKDPLVDCRSCIHWEHIKACARVAVLVNNAVEKYEARLNDKGFKPTVAEYLKLLQLEKEIEDEMPIKETHVLWVEPKAELEPLK